MLKLFPLSLVITLAGFPVATEAESKLAVHRGVYTSSFETSMFEPCDGAGKWWFAIKDTKERKRLFEAISQQGNLGWGGEFYIELHGTVSEKGRYGHLGAYEREINVQKIIRIERDMEASSDNCPVIASAKPVTDPTIKMRDF